MLILRKDSSQDILSKFTSYYKGYICNIDFNNYFTFVIYLLFTFVETTFMKDRILQLMKELNLNSTKLASEIGVQRSSISHILSGRNKPSFDFIEKILRTYPEVNPKWLIIGEGDPFVSKKQTSIPFDDKDSKKISPRELNITNKHDHNNGIGKSEKENIQTPQIKKIVIFYSDNSFEEYNPRNDK